MRDQSRVLEKMHLAGLGSNVLQFAWVADKGVALQATLLHSRKSLMNCEGRAKPAPYCYSGESAAVHDSAQPCSDIQFLHDSKCLGKQITAYANLHMQDSLSFAASVQKITLLIMPS